MTALLLQLFWTFFVIGLFTFGGGGAMLSLIQTQVVNTHAWLTEATFTDIVAISQATPGPIGINCATYVGYEVLHTAGYGNALAIFGSATATLALVLPSFLIFFGIVRIFDRFHAHPVFIKVMRTLKPAVAGLIFAAALILIFRFSGFDFWNGGALQMNVLSDNFPDWKAWTLAVTAFILSYFFKTNPIYIIIGAGVMGLLLY